MGITIATKDRRFTLKLDDGRSEELFNAIVTKILTGGGTAPGTVMKRKEPDQKWKKILPLPQQPEQEGPDLASGQPEEEDDVFCSENIREPAPSEKPKGYKGFLYLECPHCGKRRAFCSRSRIQEYKCDCGEKTELHDLAHISLKCECGSNAYYLTNVTDEIFDVNCINCGAPIAVQYNAKKKLYETI